MTYWPQCKHEWRDTGKDGFHGTPFPVRYVRCSKCSQNGYRIRPRVGKKSPDIVYTWRDDDLPPVEMT